MKVCVAAMVLRHCNHGNVVTALCALDVAQTLGVTSRYQIFIAVQFWEGRTSQVAFYICLHILSSISQLFLSTRSFDCRLVPQC